MVPVACVEFLLEEALLEVLDGVVFAERMAGFPAWDCAFSSSRAASELGWLTALNDEVSPPPLRASTIVKDPCRVKQAHQAMSREAANVPQRADAACRQSSWSGSNRTQRL